MSETMSLFYFRKEQAMDLKEQLKKVLSDQEKLERKKDDFMEEYEGKKKKILLKKKELEQKIQKEKNKKILQAVKESFGEINEKNMGTFLELLKKNSEDFSLEMEIALEETEESHEEQTEMNVPNFGTQQDNESNPYPFSEN